MVELKQVPVPSRPALLALASLVASIAAPVAARGADAPSESELRAAYCTGLLQTERKMLLASTGQSGVPGPNLSDRLANNQHNLDRLQAYLGPKLPQLDPAALSRASKQGEADEPAALVQAGDSVDLCVQSQSAAAFEACTKKFAEAHPALKGGQDCHSLDWLPPS
jgi:hypothetical protein